MKTGLRRGIRAAALVGAIAVASPPQAQAQSPEQPKACSASAYRQFDFWLGEWEVRNPKDEVVGSNTIRRILTGCVLHESWIGASGGGGQSHNIYNMQTEQWHQTWVDDSGRLLQLDG